MQIKTDKKSPSKQKTSTMKSKQNGTKTKSPKKVVANNKSPAKDGKSPNKKIKKNIMYMNRIIIKNLDTNAKKEDVEKSFNSYGKILNILLPTVKEGKKNKGIAFVSFKNSDSVEKALNETKDGLEICGSKSIVEKAGPKETAGKNKQKKTRGNKKKNKTKIVEPYELKVLEVEGIQEEQFKKHFAKFGEVKRVSIPKSKANFAFVAFTTKDSLDAAVKETKQKIEGKSVTVETANSVAHKIYGLKNAVVIYRLPKTVTDSDIKDVTEGKIVTIQRTGGLTVVSFDTAEAALTLIKQKTVEISGKSFRVSPMKTNAEQTKQTKPETPAKNKKDTSKKNKNETPKKNDKETPKKTKTPKKNKTESPVKKEQPSPNKRSAEDSDDDEEDMEVTIPSAKKQKVMNGSASPVTPNNKSPKSKNNTKNRTIVDTPRPKLQTPKSVKKNKENKETPKSVKKNKENQDTPKSVKKNKENQDTPKSVKKNKENQDTPKSVKKNKENQDTPKSVKKNKENQVSPQSEKKQKDKKRRQSVGVGIIAAEAAGTPADKKKRRQSLGVMKAVNTPKKSK